MHRQWKRGYLNVKKYPFPTTKHDRNLWVTCCLVCCLFVHSAVGEGLCWSFPGEDSLLEETWIAVYWIVWWRGGIDCELGLLEIVDGFITIVYWISVELCEKSSSNEAVVVGSSWIWELWRCPFSIACASCSVGQQRNVEMNPLLIMEHDGGGTIECLAQCWGAIECGEVLISFPSWGVIVGCCAMWLVSVCVAVGGGVSLRFCC